MRLIVPKRCSGIHTPPDPWTGAPRSPERTWAENDGAKPNERFST